MSRAREPRRARAWGVVALALALTACGGDEDGDDGAAGPSDGPTVVATTSILGDVVGELVGEDGTVEVLMPAGVDPHGFEPSARDAALLRDADLVVANGLQLEESLVSALEAAKEDGVEVFELAGHLDPLPFEGQPHADDQLADDAYADADHADDEGQQENAHGTRDPHVWHDPVRMAGGVELIADKLATVADDVDGDEWDQRARDYAEALLDVHEESEELLGQIPAGNRKLITSHDSFGYLAARYGLEVVDTVVPGTSPDAEADPGAFAELIETLEEADVSAVFSENTEGDGLSQRLVAEVRDRGGPEIEVVALYSDALGEPGGEGGSYLDLLRTNARRIADALR